MLTSNYADGNQCYVETANIDGETNLKVREAPAAMKLLLQQNHGVDDVGRLSAAVLRGKAEFEPPNKNIHNFIGALHLENAREAMALSPENILLRR